MKFHFDHKNIKEARFPILFASIILFFIGVNTFHFIDVAFRVNLLTSIILGASVFTVAGDKKIYYTAFITGSLFILLRWLSGFQNTNTNVYLSLSILFLLIFFALLFKAILVYILECKRINSNVILGVISAHLMIGILFTFIFVFIFSLDPTGTINFSNEPDFAEFLYFSMITLTTIGYGDITPISDIARLTSYSLAVIGQLYIGIVMALIIGKFLQGQNQES